MISREISFLATTRTCSGAKITSSPIQQWMMMRIFLGGVPPICKNRTVVTGEERTKIEFSRDSAGAFSFGIVDVLCGLDDDYAVSSSPAAGYSKINLHPDLFNFSAAAAMLPAPHSPFWSENSSSRASSSSSSSPNVVRFGSMKRPFGKRIKSPRKENSVLGIG
ncbi:unnamed protein product [Cuscuta epithymum]|uniref:Uncharacterized protein n=1 Tax=Cuscuta epithymum TaxID=186058 RepID=A0AAV0CKX4_9ASTE|nr:unnamed protein product [Cuscuta epithymum]